jgi:hypothetical protein
MKTKLLSVLNSLLAHNPFEEVGNVSFSLFEPQQGREFPLEVEINIFTRPTALLEKRKDLSRCHGGVTADMETLCPVETDSMRSMLEQIKSFIEATDEID